ncbi:MAG: ABC transporter substrate-binding protein [Thaumarchaeota archaeon]|nr:ABC transporter substrate-binding protein [Nitrososphaerota archaeon]
MKFWRLGAIITTLVIAIALGIFAINSNQISSSEDTVRVAFFPNIGHSTAIVGLEKEIFTKKLGDEIKIESKIFDSGPQVIESLFANSIDIAYVGPGPTINGFLKSHGQDLKIIAGAASGGASFVAHPDSGLDDANDLSGKKIAAPQISNTQDISLRHYLDQNNLTVAEKGGTVYVVNIANPDIYTLFAKGDIDAAWVPEPWATMLVQELNGKRVFFEEELWPDEKFASVLLVARSDFLLQNPVLVDRWLEAHVETTEWINANPDETEIVFNDYLKKLTGKTLPPEIIHESFSNLHITYDPIESSVLTFAQRADSLGYLGRQGYDLEGIFELQQLNSIQEMTQNG